MLVPAAVLAAALLVTTLLAGFIRDESVSLRGEAAAFVLALPLYALFYAGFFLQSYLLTNYLAPSDSLDFGVSAYLSPPSLWSQGIWSGYPVAADPQSLTWYPLLHLFRTLGIHWNSFLISAYAMTSASTFLFVRRLTRCTLAGTFAGFVCGFNALMIGYVANFNQIHAFAWMPVALYGLQLIRERRYRAGTTVAAVGVALTWLAGHPQLPVYGTYVAAAIVIGGLLLDRSPGAEALRRLQWSALALVLGLALAAVLLLPMIELGGFSTRAEPTLERYGASALPPRELLTALAPFALGGFRLGDKTVRYVGESSDSAYAGLLTVALALAAIVMPSRHRREARLWLGVGVVEALLCLGPATPVGMLFYYVPGYARFQAPLRHLFLVSLCLSVGTGIAVAALARERRLRRFLPGAITITSALAIIGVAILTSRAPDAAELRATDAAYARWAFGWPIIVGAMLMLLVAATRVLPDRRAGIVALGTLLVLAQVADMTAVHYRIPGRQFWYADIPEDETLPHPRIVALRDELHRTGERVLAADGSKNAFILPNFPRAWDIPAASGTGSLALVRYLDVLGMDTSGAVSQAAFSDAHRGVDLFAVRYVFVRQHSDAAMAMSGSPRWQLLENLSANEDDPDTFYSLFRNTRTLPRAWCAEQTVTANRDQMFAAIREGRLPDGRVFDPSRHVLVEPDAAATLRAASAAAGGTVMADAAVPRRYLVNGPCLLVFSEVAYPWWRASLDGQATGMATVNHAMFGMMVPAGSHIVQLDLRPTSVWTGAAISGAGLLLLGAIVIRPPRTTPRAPARHHTGWLNKVAGWRTPRGVG